MRFLKNIWKTGMRMKTEGFSNVAKDLLFDEKGDIQEGAVLVVVGAASLFIGLYVVDALDDAILRGTWSAAQNTTYTSILNNTFTAFNLLGVALIVIGAGLILAYLTNWRR